MDQDNKMLPSQIPYHRSLISFYLLLFHLVRHFFSVKPFQRFFLILIELFLTLFLEVAILSFPVYLQSKNRSCSLMLLQKEQRFLRYSMHHYYFPIIDRWYLHIVSTNLLVVRSHTY